MNKEKRVRDMRMIQKIAAGCIGLCLFACTETDELRNAEGKTGFVISLTDGTNINVSRATPGEIVKSEGIEGTDFQLLIVNEETKEPIYNAQVTTETINAYSGIYTLTATYGENTILALDAPYFKGEVSGVEVFSGQTTPVKIPCKVANALVSVAYDESKAQFSDVYSDYYVEVKVGSATPVQIDKTGAQSAYFQAGSTFEVIFHGTIDGADKAVTLGSEFKVPSTLKAGDHLKLTLSPKLDRFDIPLSVEGVTVQEATLTEEIPLEWLPKPKVEAEGFEGNTLSFVETEAKNAKLNLKLSSALQDIKFKFNFEDAQEQFASLDKEKDYLLSNAEDKAIIEAVLGTTLPTINATEASIDLSALVSKLQTNAGATTNNAITIDVQANNRWSSEDKSANLTYTLACNKPEFSVSVKPENCWAWEFTVDEVSVAKGDAEKIKSNLVYQYYDGTNWVDYSDGMTQKFAVDESRKNIYLEDEPEERTYQVRALYRGAIASAESTATLEEPWQLPNGDMDEWNYSTVARSIITYTPCTLGNSSFWNTNNSYTTRYVQEIEIFGSGSNPYNCFPAVSYVPRNDGKAAEIRSTAAGRGNTKAFGHTELDLNKVAGELFLGDIEVIQGGTAASPDGDHYVIQKGREFYSRPSALSFWYKYSPCNSDTWKVTIELLNENKEVIISKTHQSSETKSEYTEVTVPLDYQESVLYEQCKYIYIVFSSTINAGSSLQYNTVDYTLWKDNNQQTFEHTYVGSILTIDDISLVYDK